MKIKLNLNFKTKFYEKRSIMVLPLNYQTISENSSPAANEKSGATMRPKKPIAIRSFGQRSLPSTFLFRPCSTSTGNSTAPSQKINPGSNLSLTHFLNRNLHSTTSVLPIQKDEDVQSLVIKDTVYSTADLNPSEKTITKEKKFVSKEARDERGCVIDDSVFKVFNDSREKVRKRSSECITAAASTSETAFMKQSQNHLLVLGDDPKPKRRTRREASYSYDKPRPVYNHYENGTGWWEPEREGVDSDEVGNSDMWEGVGSTTLGGLNWD